MQSVEERVGSLEERVLALEVAFQRQRQPVKRTAPKPPPPPPPSKPKAVVQQVPAKAVGTPKPRRSLEAWFGRNLMSLIGGGAIIVAAGFLFHVAVNRGWIGPEARLALGAITGAALVGAGEWFHRKMAQFAAALTGTGIAILYVCTFAGYAHYGFYGWPAAMLFAGAITVAGMAQAWRHKVQAIAALAAAGGFFAPVIVHFVHAEPIAVLGYVTVLNVGLTWLRWRTDWRATEWVAWIGTPIAMAGALSDVSVSVEVSTLFLLANVALFSLRPRLKPNTSSPVYAFVLAFVTTAVSYVIFTQRSVPGWHWFVGGLAAVSVLSAWFGGRRDHPAAWADLVVASALGWIAIYDGNTAWKVAVGWSLLAAAILWVPWSNLRRAAWVSGLCVAGAACLHLVVYEAHTPDHRLIAFVAVALAVASLRVREAYWSAVMITACGLAAEVANARGVDPWMTLALLEPAVTLPSTRLLAGGVLAAAIAVYGGWRRDRRALQIAAAYGGMLVAADLLYAIDGIGAIPPGLVAAAALVAVRPSKVTILFVSAALAAAAAFDLMPPPEFLPFLNRRTVALGSVLAAGWWLLRGRPERPAVVLMGMLLAGAEIASLPDRAGGTHVWRHLWLDLTTETGPMALINARFLFLLAAAGAAFVASRRWRWMAVAGHIYLVAALGAEAVGIVTPELRATPQAIFLNADAFMGEHLALTGVILVYGAGLITAGILRKHALTRYVGLGMLLAGALKVSLLDLVALGELYRVGSFVVLGGTFLLGSYAYNRWVTGQEEERGTGTQSAEG